MSDSWQVGVSSLLLQCRSGFLATTGEHGPETSMAPFAMYQGNIILHLSTLARHTKNISNDNHVGFMVCMPENEGESPLSLPRLSFQGVIAPVSDMSSEDAKDAYLERIPDAESLFSFADFTLFHITPSHIQWVGGFGSARKLSLKVWDKLRV